MKKSRDIFFTVLSLSLMVTYTALCLWRLMVEAGDSPLQVVLWIAFAAFSMVSAGFFHELGHVFFGFFTGLRGKLTKNSVFSLFKPLSVGLMPKTDKNLKGRLIATSLGGLFVNLLFIAAGVLSLAVPQIPVWISGIAVGHVTLFVDNALPAEYASGKTDGLVISELVKNEPEARVTLAVLAVHAHLLSGKSIETVDKSLLFDLPQIREDDPSFISLTALRAGYCRATGDAENAEKYRARFEQLKAEYID